MSEKIKVNVQTAAEPQDLLLQVQKLMKPDSEVMRQPPEESLERDLAAWASMATGLTLEESQADDEARLYIKNALGFTPKGATVPIIESTIANKQKVFMTDPVIRRCRIALDEISGEVIIRNYAAFKVIYDKASKVRSEKPESKRKRKVTKEGTFSDSQIISVRVYFQDFYGMSFSKDDILDLVRAMAEQNSFNPFVDYLESLTWDGTPRAETLLIDYLGAEDTPLIRSITRKTLRAVIERSYEPGCKFDNMLVLVGPQGQGKSTIFAELLPGELFSDGITFSDFKDTKVLAEKMSGSVVWEIAELNAMTKVDVTTVKSILSMRRFKIRKSYDRMNTLEKFHGIFIGTTNSESGFLRDTTGNRRFWPVRTDPEKATKSVFTELTPEIAAQIWAEAMTWEDEELRLSNEEAAAFEKEKREFIETDETVEVLRDLLSYPIPENWNKMNTTEKQHFYRDHAGFLKSTTTGQLITTGALKTGFRDAISPLEVYVEMYGGDMKAFNKSIRDKIINQLQSLGCDKEKMVRRLGADGKQARKYLLPEGLFKTQEFSEEEQAEAGYRLNLNDEI